MVQKKQQISAEMLQSKQLKKILQYYRWSFCVLFFNIPDIRKK